MQTQAPASSATSPRYRAVTLEGPVQERVRSLLRAGERAQLRVVMEVLEITSSGRALVWIHDERGRGDSRLACCRLSPAQLAEALLAQEGGARVGFEVRFEVLGQLRSGQWGVLVQDSQVRLVVLPPTRWPSLESLLAA